MNSQWFYQSQVLKTNMTHILSLDDWQKWSSIYRTRNLVLHAAWGKDNELLSNYLELWARYNLALGESVLKFKSEVAAEDEYLGDIMKVTVKFRKIIQCIRQALLRKSHRSLNSEPLKLLSVFDYMEIGCARKEAYIEVKRISACKWTHFISTTKHSIKVILNSIYHFIFTKLGRTMKLIYLKISKCKQFSNIEQCHIDIL